MELKKVEGTIEALLFAMGESVELSALAKAIGHDVGNHREDCAEYDAEVLRRKTGELRLLSWKMHFRCVLRKSIMIIW